MPIKMVNPVLMELSNVSMAKTERLLIALDVPRNIYIESQTSHPREAYRWRSDGINWWVNNKKASWELLANALASPAVDERNLAVTIRSKYPANGHHNLHPCMRVSLFSGVPILLVILAYVALSYGTVPFGEGSKDDVLASAVESAPVTPTQPPSPIVSPSSSDVSCGDVEVPEQPSNGRKISLQKFPHMDKRPTMDQLQRLKRADGKKPVRIIERIGNHNADLGTILLKDEDGAIMMNIKHDARDYNTPIMREVFRQWVNGRGYPDPVNWSVLVKALINVDLIELAKDVVDALHDL